MPTGMKHIVENADASMLDTQKPQLAANVASVRERRAKGDSRDSFTVSPSDRKKYGVKEGEVLKWARSPEHWEKYEKKDRLAELTDSLENGGKEARVLHKNGEFDRVTLGDLVLVAVPAEVAADDQALIDEARAEYERDLMPDQEYNGRAGRSHQNLRADGLAPYNPSDEQAIFNLARAESRSNHQTGLIGGNSRTAGMSLAEARRMMAGREAEVTAKQDMLRTGGQHSALPAEKFHEMMLGGERQVKALFGMSESGFPRNPNSAVAQAARKNKGR